MNAVVRLLTAARVVSRETMPVERFHATTLTLHPQHVAQGALGDTVTLVFTVSSSRSSRRSRAFR